MSNANLRVLSFQKVFSARDWAVIRSRPDVKDNIILGEARREIADAIARDGLVTFVTSEPGSDDVFTEDCAVIRATVAVASKDETAHLALALAEAEERGFRAAINAMNRCKEDFSPRLGPTAFERSAVDRLIEAVVQERAHAPAADWRPMWSLRWSDQRAEYLFTNGDIGRQHRIAKLKERPLVAADFSGDAASGTEEQEVFEAIAWRPFGRLPHREPRA